MRYESNTKLKRNQEVYQYFKDHPDLALQEIGATFKLSRQRIWQIVQGRRNVKSLIPFDFKGKSVDVYPDEHGNPRWVAKQVCDVLQLCNSRKAVTALDDDERMTVTLSDSQPGHGAQVQTLITEPGLYKLAMRSRKPIAKEFQRWIAHEVIPSIRMTGSYGSINETSRVGAVKDLVGLVKDMLTNKIKETKALPAVRSIASRDQVGKVVRTYAKINRLDFQACWKELYSEFLYRYHIDLYQRAQAKGTTGVAIAEELGMIDDLLSLANFLYDK